MSKVIEFINLTPDWIDYYLKWFNDEKVRRFLWPSTPRQRDKIKHWLTKVAFSPKYRYFGIKVDGYPVGHTGMTINFRRLEAKIGVVIGEPSYWGQGIATLCAAHLIKEGKKLRLRTLKARVVKENKPSLRTLLKNNFEIYYQRNCYYYLRFFIDK